MKINISTQEIEDHIRDAKAKKAQLPKEIDLRYAEAAAVLYYFDPDVIAPFNADAASEGWDNFFLYSVPVRTSVEGNYWELKDDVRIEALTRLKTRDQMQKAIASNPNRIVSNGQKLLDDVVFGRPIDFQELMREELGILSTIYQWLDGIVTTKGEVNKLKRAIPIADLLAPMKRLAGKEFVGRQNELNFLADYVGVRPSSGILRSGERFIMKLFDDLAKNPPVLIFGPGGMGKSSLLARFILLHTDEIGERSLPFVYLDVDRNSIDPEKPLSFILESCQQLSLQTSQPVKKSLLKLKEKIERALRTNDLSDAAKRVDDNQEFYHQFSNLIGGISSPVLLVVDTFEEAQYLGREVVFELWQMFERLQKNAPNLRTVIAGRVEEKDFPVKARELKELSKADGIKVVKTILEQPGGTIPGLNKVVEEIIDIVGLNPLSLRLAANIVKVQGLEKLKSVETKTWLVLRVRSEIIQARLYGRILSHLHDENKKDLKKLAYPGLLLRRITPEIILKVLAAPCKLTVANLDEARLLFNEFAQEISLVEEDTSGALCHRQNVRKIMLPDLVNEIDSTLIKKIHDNAVEFYSDRTDVISKAEEIYHRLLRGDNPETTAELWNSEVANRLRTSLDELPTGSRLWVSKKLGITPDGELIKNADLESWEEFTAVAAQRYLAHGNAEMALQLMSERKERTPNSKLFRLELEALRLSGEYDLARKLVNDYIPKALTGTSTEIIKELFVQAALIYESGQEIEKAVGFISEAQRMLSANQRTIEALRISITHLRLLRKVTGAYKVNDAEPLKTAMDIATNDFLFSSSLRNSPALFREVVAELGEHHSLLIDQALEYIGLDKLEEDPQAELLAIALFNWNEKLKQEAITSAGELAERAGLTESTKADWLLYTKTTEPQALCDNIRHWRQELGKSTSLKAFDKALVELYRYNVDLSLNKANVNHERILSIRSEATDIVNSVLSPDKTTIIAEQIASSFSSDEIFYILRTGLGSYVTKGINMNQPVSKLTRQIIDEANEKGVLDKLLFELIKFSPTNEVLKGLAKEMMTGDKKLNR